MSTMANKPDRDRAFDNGVRVNAESDSVGEVDTAHSQIVVQRADQNGVDVYVNPNLASREKPCG